MTSANGSLQDGAGFEQKLTHFENASEATRIQNIEPLRER